MGSFGVVILYVAYQGSGGLSPACHLGCPNSISGQSM